jgi:hypothetical protein
MQWEAVQGAVRTSEARRSPRTTRPVLQVDHGYPWPCRAGDGGSLEGVRWRHRVWGGQVGCDSRGILGSAGRLGQGPQPGEQNVSRNSLR